jgi:eukaryotic-like serine/threonine-protein kinase
MAVPTGTRLGPYEIVSRVGAGGMGEVFRARDTRLQRTVAIKILSADVDARRFQQEARAASELSHPGICMLFDVGNQDGTDFLVMEYLEGETLAERLRRGRVPPDQGLQIASELLDGLAHAHRHGIIHRDLKPQNIMLVRSGSRVSAKILDFGLAKRTAVAAADDQTATLALTHTNVVVGTPKYMAPEQIEGRAADVRTDVYAMGLVLQELLPAASTTETLQQVLKRSVASEPDERWQSAADFRAALDVARMPASVPVSGERRRWMWIAAAVLAAVFAVGALLISWPRRDRAADPITFSFGAPGKTTLAAWPGVPSPDGRRIAFVAWDEAGQSSLWIRSLAAEVPQRIAGTETASGPFWSPDGRMVGFFAQGKLKKVDASGGPPQNICDALVDLGATWSTSGDIVFAPANRTVLHRVAAAGGTPEPITRLNEELHENSHRWPHFLPDGRHFLFTARSSVKENTAIYVGSLGSVTAERLLSAQSNASYAPPGHLLFGREGTLMAQSFDPSSLTLSGEAVPVAANIAHVTPSASAMFSVARDGGVLTYQKAYESRATLNWVDRTGASTGTITQLTHPSGIRLSPDGKRAALVLADRESGNRDVWLLETASGALTRLTFSPANDWMPVWSPDGTHIAYASDRNERSTVYRKAVDGSGTEEPLIRPTSGGGVFPLDWSRDGRSILYQVDKTKAGNDLWILPLFGDRKPYPFLATDFFETGATFSPDGQWVAYTSNESGSFDVYIKPARGPGKVRVSPSGGAHPKWSANGEELFFIAPGNVMSAANVAGRDTLQVSTPKSLFRVCTASRTGYETYYGVAPDGKRFLITCAGETTQRSIAVMTRWTANFKDRSE